MNRKRARFRGCKRRRWTKPDGEVFPLLEPEYMVPEKHWRELCERNGPLLEHAAANTPWIFQKNQNSCCPSAGGTGMQIVNFGEGEDVELLSQATIYHFDIDYRTGQIVRRTRDDGMAIDVCGRLLEEFGMCTAEEIDPLDWQGRNWPDDWKRRAARNRLTERLKDLPNMAAVMSWLSHGKPILHGYGQHARILVRALFGPSGSRPTRFKAKNTWKSEPWHYLTWNQIAQGLDIYGGVALTVTTTLPRR